MKENQQGSNAIHWRNAVTRLGIERLIISGTFNCISGLAFLVGLKALGISFSIAIPIAILFALSGTFLLAMRLPAELIGIRIRKPWLSFFWFITALAGVLLIGRLSIFMIDPLQTQYSLFPGDQWLVEHCCLTAYSESAKFASAGEKNIYDQLLYMENVNNKGSNDLIPFRKLENFKVDLYHYPPTFLLLPLICQAVTGGDFLNLRMLWFAIGVLCLITTLGLIIYRLEHKGKLRMIGMTPLVLCSLPVLVGFQMSNVQIIVISISIISMLLIPISKPIGGLLLAMSSVAKIFPGILIIYLLAKGKFREVFWVAGFAVVLSVLAFIIVGSNPFQAFIEYELPKLSSGEAFSRPFTNAFAVARNIAPFGVPLKLGWLGVPGMTLEVGRIVSSIHLLMVIILAIWSGRQKPRSNTEMISVWISLIALGSLVSPFAPANYVLVSVILIVCLNREYFRPWAAITIWLIISAPFFISREVPFLVQAISFLPSQFIAIAVPAFILYRAGLKTVEEQKAITKAYVAPEVSTD